MTAESQSQQPLRLDKDTFLERVRASGLIPEDRLQRALAAIPETHRGRVMARALVQQGVLTRFQAERLLGGKTKGFILGQYKILDELGRGGMGRVYKAEHQTMGRVVALKLLSSALMNTERAKLLFQREVKAAAKLSHPNIVTAYDANQIGEQCFLVMEFVDGPNLQSLVQDKGPLAVGQACDFIRQAAIGLQSAHSIGMVHRDIKPANLLVQKNTSKATSGEYTVKILDFGLARISHAEEPANDTINGGKATVMGTPDFLSPEQARNLHDLDSRADIYSLGCSFYFLLTGQVPFPGGSTLEKLVRHTTEKAPDVRLLRPEVPEALAAVLDRMLAKHPDERFQSGNDVAAALAPFSDGVHANWIAVESIPVIDDLPAVATPASLPRPGGDSDFSQGSDPWTDIAESAAPTLSNDDNFTDMTVGKRVRRTDSRQTRAGSASSIWFWLAPLLFFVVAIIAALATMATLR